MRRGRRGGGDARREAAIVAPASFPRNSQQVGAQLANASRIRLTCGMRCSAAILSDSRLPPGCPNQAPGPRISRTAVISSISSRAEASMRSRAKASISMPFTTR